MKKTRKYLKTHHGKLYNNRVLRYFFSAGSATLVDVVSYFLIFNYVFEKQDIRLGPLFVFSASTATLFVSYTLGLITNFTITRSIVFNNSDLRLSSQFIRYLLVAFLVLVANYYLMSFLIKVLDWYPTIARAFSAVIVGLGSFLLHKFFSFRAGKKVTL
ncbi:MAG: GtrA family protein [Nitrosopumilus sp.]|nr:GtrA family protein [Nitrosopumilus sp.]